MFLTSSHTIRSQIYSIGNIYCVTLIFTYTQDFRGNMINKMIRIQLVFIKHLFLDKLHNVCNNISLSTNMSPFGVWERAYLWCDIGT